MGDVDGTSGADAGPDNPAGLRPTEDADQPPVVRKPGQYAPSGSQTEHLGVNTVEAAVRFKLDWRFRNQAIDDFGIDAQAEVVHDDGLVSGRLLAMQIKAGDSYFAEPNDDGWVYRGHSGHLSYWLGHSLPVIVVLVDSNANAYWQVIRPETVRETEKGFVLTVPRDQRLDASSKESLLALVGRSRGLVDLLPEYKAVLPGGAIRRLTEAEQADGLGAARLAERLANGRHQPDLTAAAIIASKPSWLVGSPSAEELWWAVGSFAASHGCNAQAAEAFAAVADLGGPDARALALSGLCLLFLDRDTARQRLERANSQSQTMLADIGLASLDFPENDARAFDTPRSIADATDAELEAEPMALNFLAEMATRRGDLTGAVKLYERAVAASIDDDSAMRDSLAQALGRRRTLERQSSKDYRDAVVHAQTALESRRRWDGPSAEVLGTLLDLHISALEGTAGLTAALPGERGGTASDLEASDPQVGRRGAVAALIARRFDDYAWFLEQLPPGPAQREVELLAEERLATDADPSGQAARLQQVLKGATEDDMRARCVGRLVQLGVWPDEADDLLARSIIQADMHATFRAIYTATAVDWDTGVDDLRDLARRWAPAASQLVALLDEHGSDDAISECQLQLDRWADPILTMMLADLHRAKGGDAEAAEIVERNVTNEELSVDVRLAFCHWYTGMKAAEKDHPAVARVARIGLGLREDPDLAWDLVRALTNSGSTPEAREALNRYRPTPGSDDEVKLWMHLHLGVPLSADEVRTMADLLRRQPEGNLRDGMVGVLVREVGINREGGDPYPAALVDEVRDLVETIQPGVGSGTRPVPDDEALRSVLETELPEPGQWDRTIAGIRRGVSPMADAAAQSGRPYGAVLLQRPAAMIVASDRTPGVVAAGEAAAREAVDGAACVIDLSSLHLLNLVDRRSRLGLTKRLPSLHVTRTAAEDALRTRDAMRSLAAASYTAALEPDGTISRTTLSAIDRGLLADQAEALEEATATADAHWLDEWTDPARDAVELAHQLGLPLWCDDCAVQQLARGRRVAAFGLLDLAEVVDQDGGGLDRSAIRLAIAERYVVDVPLTAAEMIDLGSRNGWVPGPLTTQLIRPGWWRQAGAAADVQWATVAGAAIRVNADGVVDLIKASLSGAIEAVSGGRSTQRYQQLVVLALAEFHDAGVEPPTGLLVRLAEGAQPSLPPKSEYVRRALAEELRRRGAANPVEAALTLVPEEP